MTNYAVHLQIMKVISFNAKTLPMHHRDLSGYDFLLKGHHAASGPLSVLYLTESDFVGGNKRFKQRLAKFYTASRKDRSDATVICQRTEASTSDFLGVQGSNSVVLEIRIRGRIFASFGPHLIWVTFPPKFC